MVMRATPVMRAVARKLLPSTRTATTFARSAVLSLFIIDNILARVSIVKGVPEMMADDRPPDWDWVTATYKCKAEAMFGRLQALAQRDVETRNKQLGREVFKLIEINGIEFLVSKDASRSVQVYFKVMDDLARISVRAWQGEEAMYTVGMDDTGICRFRNGVDQLDAWQVLKAALGPLLFG